jgi:Na+:H+ antiporter, NhaA family
MTVFFLVVGLEIKRELVAGELRTWRRAAMPVVAAAGAGAVLGGVLVGRVLGKLAGIGAAAWLAVRLGLAVRPPATSWPQLAGVATVAGIGFTVPLLVADLAFPDGRFQAPVKLGLLLASVVAGATGALVLWLAARGRPAGT